MRAIIHLVFIVFMLPSVANSQDIITGPVTHVFDGDTVKISAVRIRLQGLHVPELGTTSGDAAGLFLRRAILGKLAQCRLSGDVSYNRLVARCFIDGHDIAEFIITNGHGRDCPRYSGGRYLSFEQSNVNNWMLPAYCRVRS